MNKKLIVGISAMAARSGKDTLCQILINKFKEKGIAAKRIALADPLKTDLRSSLLEEYNIDILNCSPEQKEKMRPHLVAYGKKKRQQTNGQYFTKLADQEINKSDEDVIIVSDIRYAAYKEVDEVFWVKNHSGVLIHVSRSNNMTDLENISSRRMRTKELTSPY